MAQEYSDALAKSKRATRARPKGPGFPSMPFAGLSDHRLERRVKKGATLREEERGKQDTDN